MGGLPRGTVLNVDGEHNLKIVCDNGREYVFDKDGKIIPDGINEGTFNISNPENWASHTLNDIIAAIKRLPNKSSMTKDECVKLLKDYQEREVKAKEQAEALFTGIDNFSVDISQLEALIKKMIEFSQRLLDAGEKATDRQISTYNSYAAEAGQELGRLLQPILALPISDAEKSKIVAEKIERKLKTLVERHQTLQKQLVSRGVVDGLRPVSFDDLCHSGTKQTGDNSNTCVCPNPDYNATIPAAGPGWATCTKCGKLLGIISNRRFISTNPAVNGKSVK